MDAFLVWSSKSKQISEAQQPIIKCTTAQGFKHQKSSLKDLNGYFPIQLKNCSFPKNSDNRSFQSSWYLRFSWLEYSEETLFSMPNISSGTTKRGFITSWYRNWKRALGDKSKRLLQHQGTSSHINAMRMWKKKNLRVDSNRSVSTLVNDGSQSVIHCLHC